MYIDPPYYFKEAKPQDSFRYNSNFKFSSWLIFMKNRLEIAKELLTDDGVIFVHTNEDGNAYLKVLMDELFLRENFVTCLPRVTKKGGKSTDVFADNHDYVLVYSKINKKTGFYPMLHNDKGFKNQDEFFETRGFYKLNQTLDYDSLQYSSSLDYPIKINGEVFYAGGNKERYIERKNGNHLRADWAWRWSKDLFEFGLNNGFIEIKRTKNGARIYTKTYQNVKIENINGDYQIVEKERTRATSTLEFSESLYSNDNATKHMNDLFPKGTFEYTKPESLIHQIIALTTNPNDIVLDYHLGSGTTCAVAHKMGRRWIGIEQMDYIDDITKTRLLKVLQGEQGGISKAVDWNGGGSFCYFELKKYNQYFIDKILVANTMGELDTVYNEMAKNAFFKFWFDKEKFQKAYKKDKDDNQISLDDRKQILISVLDENQLYLNYADMGDSRYQVRDDEKALSDAFYGE
nr:site-specific DNA-methyltransferase [Moraxella bovis]